jgi:hypothetical protein
MRVQNRGRHCDARFVITRCKRPKKAEGFAASVGRGLRRAGWTARAVARMHASPIYVWENGKIVAKDLNNDAE